MSHIYDFRTTRSYQGSVQAVILDWAGTILDFGCVAPAVVFVEVFKRHQVALSLDESRGPMGAEKKDHIRMLTELAAVRQRWIDAHGRAPNEQDVETMYAEFIPLQLDVLAQYSELIPGALDTLQELRAQDIKIGTTTGYNREMTEINLRVVVYWIECCQALLNAKCCTPVLVSAIDPSQIIQHANHNLTWGCCPQGWDDLFR